MNPATTLSSSDLRTVLELFMLLASPVFAAGGAWWAVRYAVAEIGQLRASQRRIEVRVANLYGYLKLRLPPESDAF